MADAATGQQGEAQQAPTEQTQEAQQAAPDNTPSGASVEGDAFQRAKEKLLSGAAKSDAAADDGGEGGEAQSDAAATAGEQSSDAADATQQGGDDAGKDGDDKPAKKKRAKPNRSWRQSLSEAAAAKREAEEKAKEATSERARMEQQIVERDREISELQTLREKIQRAREADDPDEAVRLMGIADNVAELTKRKLAGNQKAAKGDPEIKKLIEEQNKELASLRGKIQEREQREKEELEAQREQQRREKALSQIREELETVEMDEIAGTDNVPGYRSHDGFIQFVLHAAEEHPNASEEQILQYAAGTYDSMLSDLLSARFGIDLSKLGELVNGTATTNGEASNGSPDQGNGRASGKRSSRGSNGLPQSNGSADGRSRNRSGTSVSTQSAESAARPTWDPSQDEHDAFRRFTESKLGKRA